MSKWKAYGDFFVGLNGQNGEKIKLSRIRKLFEQEFLNSGFTLIEAGGFWKEPEESVIIEHLEELKEDKAEEIKNRPQRELDQQAIVVTKENLKVL